MLDTKALERAVEKQIAETVNEQVLSKLATDDWLVPVEQKIIKFTQDRIIGKFNNSSALPEIIDAIKDSVEGLFQAGQIPGIENFIDHKRIQQAVDLAVEKTIVSAIQTLNQDPTWQEKIETLAKQAMTQRIVANLSTIDIASLVNQRVDENFQMLRKDVLENFTSTGISDQATVCQLTIMDSDTVVENKLTTESLEVVNELTVKDLTVKGSINTDNRSWHTLANSISEITLEKLTRDWTAGLIQQVTDKISEQGINFNEVKINGDYLVIGNQLSEAITHTNIQNLGVLKELQVRGEAHINDSVHVYKNRVGINTESPDRALSIWDEEVSVSIGKHKSHEAYIGTTRDQALNIGINKQPMITIDTTGLTSVKKLRVGYHTIGHHTDAPNWAGVRGDIVFNSNPTPGSPFAWLCLGSFKWKSLKAVE